MTAALKLPLAGALPPPVTRVRSKPCVRCPSAHYPHDEESRDIVTSWPRDAQLETVFTCAWTPGQLCRGWVDCLGASDEEAMAVVRARETT